MTEKTFTKKDDNGVHTSILIPLQLGLEIDRIVACFPELGYHSRRDFCIATIQASVSAIKERMKHEKKHVVNIYDPI